MSDELPKGWATASLSTIAEINPRHLKDLDGAMPVTFVPMAALSESKPGFQFTEERPLGEVRKGFTHFAERDVLFAKITPCMENGKGAVARGLQNKLGCGTTELHVIRPLADISAEYIYRFLAQDKVRRAAKENFTGTAGQARVPTSFIEELEVPLAPLAEQRRIVAKLETLLGKVDACQQRLTEIPVLLKRFRQSVLAAACSGRLTADWREENPDVGNAKSQIKAERFSLSESEENLPELAETWAWVGLGNYAHCFRGRFSPRPRNDPRYFNGKHPFIQIGNLPREGGFVTSYNQTLNDEGLAVSRKFPKGTVVIAIVGATIGNTGVLAYEMCVTDSLVGMETGTPEGNRYVEFFLRHMKHDIRQASYSSGGQPNIKLEFLYPYPFALPPLPEQQEIVRRVEGLFALADQLEKRLAKARGQVDKLTPSLLARAFAGKLVPQDPTDEPASALLARIRNHQIKKP